VLVRSAGIHTLMIFKLLAQAEEPRCLSSAGFVPCLDEQAGERINRAYQYSFKHCAGRLNHQDIAQVTGMSLSALCHYFRELRVSSSVALAGFTRSRTSSSRGPE